MQRKIFTETWRTIITSFFFFFFFFEYKYFIEIYVSLILTDGAAEVLKSH